MHPSLNLEFSQLLHTALVRWCTAVPSNQQAASELTGNQCLSSAADAASACAVFLPVCVNQCIALISWQSIITAKTEQNRKEQHSQALWACCCCCRSLFIELILVLPPPSPLLTPVERSTPNGFSPSAVLIIKEKDREAENPNLL